MANPLFGQFGGQQMNPMAQLLADARRLKQTMTANPRETVQQLVASGQMSQEQFNQFAQIAQQIVCSGALK